MSARDLTGSSRDLLAPVCASCEWWQTAAPGAAHPQASRRAWEAAVEAEAGFFGRALLDGDDVLGWMHVAPAALAARAQTLPTGPPSADAYLLLCAYFYDEEYLNGFQHLLQEIEAALKIRGVAALEAFATRRRDPADRFRGYLRDANLFHAGVLEGMGFRVVRRRGDVLRCRLELDTLIAVPRRSRVRAERETGPAIQPV
jgi:hypothetical protein